MVHRIFAAILTVGLVLTTGALHARIEPAAIAARDADAFVPKPEFAKLLSLGFEAVLADFYWLQAVQVIGGDRADPARYGTHLGRLIDVVTTLDPWVDHPYRFAAIWLTGTPDDVRMANHLLRRSLDYHPWEWRNRFYLGYNLFFYLGENEEAAESLLEAVQLPGSPRYLPRLVARLRSEHADIETAEVFLQELLRDAEDDATRAEYQSALDEIEVEHKARFLDRAREAFQKLNGRDIARVEELAQGSLAVLNELPPASPSSVPPALSHGHVWEVDPHDGRIVSTYYDHRYELKIDASERQRLQGWREAQAPSTPSESPGDDRAGG